MAFRIQITRPAKRDAQEYAAFIREEHDSPAAAHRWLDGLYAAIKELNDAPKRYSVIPEAVELGCAYRSFVYYSHRIIYEVDEANRLVTIHRVHHGARKALEKGDLP